VPRGTPAPSKKGKKKLSYLYPEDREGGHSPRQEEPVHRPGRGERGDRRLPFHQEREGKVETFAGGTGSRPERGGGGGGV